MLADDRAVEWLRHQVTMGPTMKHNEAHDQQTADIVPLRDEALTRRITVAVNELQSVLDDAVRSGLGIEPSITIVEQLGAAAGRPNKAYRVRVSVWRPLL